VLANNPGEQKKLSLRSCLCATASMPLMPSAPPEIGDDGQQMDSPLVVRVILSLKNFILRRWSGTFGLVAISVLCLPSVPAVASTGPIQRTPGQVLLVFNAASPISTAIARDYAAKRHVENVLSITCPDSALRAEDETITLPAYTTSIEEPIRHYLAVHAAIDFIVLTKGVPIRIRGATTGWGVDGMENASVDSTLAALDYDKIPGAVKIGVNSTPRGYAWLNRYWNADEPFSHAKFGGYLVTRLDGYTEADAEALVTRSLAAEKGLAPEGKVLFDIQTRCGLGNKATQPAPITGTFIAGESAWSDWNADMLHAADILTARHIPVEVDVTPSFIGHRAHLLGYFSWGSNDSNYTADAYQSLSFDPGSISDTAVSTSGRTFLPTSGGQSLLVDLLAHGLTAGKGYTDEPFLQAIASPTIVMDRYTRGYTMAESFYAASHFVGWEDVVVGDPLCRPYPQK